MIELLDFNAFLIDIVQSQYEKLTEDLIKRVAQNKRVEYHQNTLNDKVNGNAFNKFSYY